MKIRFKDYCRLNDDIVIDKGTIVYVKGINNKMDKVCVEMKKKKGQAYNNFYLIPIDLFHSCIEIIKEE